MNKVGIARAVVVLSVFTLFGVDTASSGQVLPTTLGYRLSEPDVVHRLHPSLQEVSGLSWTPEGSLAAIEDEHGILYTLDPASGKILDRFRFGSDRDYEAVEYVGDRVWVLESDGDLYSFHTEGKKRLKRYKTRLDAGNDTEGLTMLADGRLVVLCKEDPGMDVAGRTLWMFDPDSKKLSDTPLAILPGVEFKPSGLSIHPKTGDIYVISSRPAALVVMSSDGILTSAFRFDLEDMTQPEGIAFAPDGTLYIASEGGSGRGHLFIFSPVSIDQ